MTINDLSAGAGASSAIQVKLLKGQQSQEKAVVSKILEGAAKSAPSQVTGKGGKVDVIA